MGKLRTACNVLVNRWEKLAKQQENSFVNRKIYEAKRGSLIVNQKISLNSSKKSLSDFISKFANDISS